MSTRDGLHRTLEKTFGKVSRNKGSFRHYGMQVDQLDDRIQFSQADYMLTLNAVIIEGTRKEQDLNEREVTDFRSLTCGISWMGMTSGGCQAASSLY